MSLFDRSQAPMMMGILNVTPDSFSDGGDYQTVEDAVNRAVNMHQQGASIIDVGGESTRPGAKEVSTQEQIDRVLPVIEGIRQSSANEVIISIDTTDYEVAEAALNSGANWLNDISAGEDSYDKQNQNEDMISLAASYHTPIVLMHRQGKSDRMQDNPHYEDVCMEVTHYLQERANMALSAGLEKSQILLDPGIGFGKLLAHNLSLLAHLNELVALGFPVLLGTSRKRFIGDITQQDDPKKRVAGTCATTALGVMAGVSVFRVHDVEENKQALDIAWAIKNGY